MWKIGRFDMQSRQDFDDFLSLQIKNLEAKKCSELAKCYLEDYIKKLPKQFIDNYMNFVVLRWKILMMKIGLIIQPSNIILKNLKKC